MAVDGHVTKDVLIQTYNMPKDASHLIVSCGGNDALGYSNLLYEPAKSVAEVLQLFTKARLEFQHSFRKMLAHILNFKKPTAVCTIYDSVPDLEDIAVTALSIFNEIILREVFFGRSGYH